MYHSRNILRKVFSSFQHAGMKNESEANERTWISAITKHLWIIAVVQKVLDVSQLMVNGYKIFMRYVGAHFDSANMKTRNK